MLPLSCLILIPFQAGTEEFFFRGYLAQGVGAWTKNRLFVVVIPSLCFALMHSFNPEVEEFGFWLSMPNYLAFGLLFGIVCVLDDGIEMAVGIHASNNIFSSVLVTSKSSVLQTSALFVQKEINPVKETLILLLISFLFLLISMYKSGWKFNVLFSKIKPLEKVQVES